MDLLLTDSVTSSGFSVVRVRERPHPPFASSRTSSDSRNESWRQFALEALVFGGKTSETEKTLSFL